MMYPTYVTNGDTIYCTKHLISRHVVSWWRHQMETFSVLLAICAGNSPVTGEFPLQRPVTQSFDIFVDLRLNKRLSKQSRGWWFETPSGPSWRQCNVLIYEFIQMPSWIRFRWFYRFYQNQFRVSCPVLFPTMRRYLQLCTCLLVILGLELWKHLVESTCTPFSYDHQPECSDSLAASTFSLCGSMDFSLKRAPCQVETLDDMDALLTVARILGYNYVSSIHY